jgi:hypothetical protein
MADARPTLAWITHRIYLPAAFELFARAQLEFGAAAVGVPSQGGQREVNGRKAESINQEQGRGLVRSEFGRDVIDHSIDEESEKNFSG